MTSCLPAEERLDEHELSQVYATSGRKLGFESDPWGQPPAAHYYLAKGTEGTFTGVEVFYVSSSRGFQPHVWSLEEELEAWEAASDEDFSSLRLDV